MILHGDCLEQLKSLAAASVDSVVTDPPAGIAFMGKAWDTDKGGRREWVAWLTEVMRETLRVLKPGGHALVWAIPRTSHWTATALEDAGFEIRDVVTHVFGTGFPKSLDVSKAIDKAAGVQRELKQHTRCPNRYAKAQKTHTATADYETQGFSTGPSDEPATDAARQWQGFGTALKPASEHWILCRKPLAEKTVAANVLAHGTGALNVDKCRVTTAGPLPDDDACTRLSALYYAACSQRLEPSRVQDALRRIAAALLPYSTAGIDLGRGEGARDGRSLEGDEYARLVARLFPSGAWCGQTPTRAQGSLGDCPAYRRFCDELAPILQAAAQGGAPSLHDALVDISPTLFGRTRSLLSQCNARLSTEGASRLWDLPLLAWLLSFSVSTPSSATPQGRFPANLVLSHNDDCEDACSEGCAVAELDRQSGTTTSKPGVRRNKNLGWKCSSPPKDMPVSHADSGGASRFFYTSKASRKDRGEGNTHPTVKSTALMRYLCRLVTPPGGIVLDPFAGSGSTGVAALMEGFQFLGIEREAEYVAIAENRLKVLGGLFRRVE